MASFSRLEPVRTLRELGAGLDEIREVLASETTLSSVATRHLELLEGQLRLLRYQASGAAGGRPATANRRRRLRGVGLMHKLANMSDEQRERLIDASGTKAPTI